MKLPQLPQLPNVRPIGGQIPTVPPVPILPKVPTVPSASIMPYGSKWIPTPAQQQAYAQNDLLLDYNDPYELNSMADVISASFNDRIDNANKFTEGPLQLLNIIPNTVKLIKDTTIKPISQGEFGKAALNNLMNFAETLDIFANPVKGYMMGGQEGWIKGWGFSDAGRKNYDWDTGSLGGDMIMELISDPLNWLTLFAKPIISGATKASLKTVLTEGGAVAGKNLDDIVKAATRAYMRGSKKDVVSALTDVAKMIGSQVDDSFVKSFEVAMEHLVKGAEYNTNMKILKGLSGMVKVADKVDDALMGLAIKSTPGLALPWLAKKGMEPIYIYAYEEALKNATQFMTPNGIVDLMQLDEFEKAFDQQSTLFNKVAARVFGKRPLDKVLKEGLITGAVETEVNTLTKVLKELNLEKFPDVTPEYKVSKLYDYLDSHFDGDYQTFLDVIHQYNIDNEDKYKWFEDWLNDSLDYEKQLALHEDIVLKRFEYAQKGLEIKENIAKRNELNFAFQTEYADQVVQEIEVLKNKLNMIESIMEMPTSIVDDGIGDALPGQFRIELPPDWDAIKSRHITNDYVYRGKEILNDTRAADYILKQYEQKSLHHFTQQVYSLKEFVDVEVKGRALTPRQVRLRLNKFTRKQWGVTYDILVNNLKASQKVLGKDFDWFFKYIKEVVDIGPHRIQISTVYDFIKNELFTGQDVSAAVKFELLNEFIQGQHKADVYKYIEHIEKLNNRFEGKFNYMLDSMRSIVDEYRGREKYTKEISKKLNLSKTNDLIKQVHVPKARAAIEVYFSKIPDVFKSIVNDYRPDLDLPIFIEQLKTILYGSDEKGKVIVGLVQDGMDNFKAIADDIIEIIEEAEKRYTKEIIEDGAISKKFYSEFRAKIKDAIERALNALKEDYSIADAYSSASHRTTIEQGFKDTTKVFKDNYDEVMKAAKGDTTGKHKQYKSRTTSSLTAEEIIELQDEFYAKLFEASEVTDDTVKYIFGVRLEDVNKKLTSTNIPGVLQSWYSLYGEYTGVSPDGFQQRVLDFITAPFEDPDMLLETWESLSGLIKHMQRHLESLEHTPSNVIEAIKSLGVFAEEIDSKITNQVEDLINIQIDAIYYTFQLEKMYVTELALSDKNINDIMDKLVTPGTIEYAALRNMASEGDARAVHALEGVRHFGNYRDFRVALAEADIPREIKTAFLSTIHNFSRVDAREIYENLDKYLYAMFKKTEQHYNGITMAEHLNITELFDRYVYKDIKAQQLYFDYLDELDANNLTGQAHIAVEDNIMLKYICEALLSKELPDGENIIKVFLDTETSGLNRSADVINQVSAYVSKSDHLEMNFNTGLPPATKVIKSMLDSEITDKKTLYQLYSEIFDKDAVNELVGYIHLFDYLEDKVLTGQQVKLIIHNGDNFDIPLIKNRLERLVEDAASLAPNIKNAAESIYIKSMAILDKVQVVDTLRLIQKQQGYLSLDKYVKGQLSEIVKALADKQSTFEYAFMDTLYKPYLIQPLNSSVGRMLHEIAASLREDLKLGKMSMPNKRFEDLLGSVGAAFAGDEQLIKSLHDSGSEILEFFKLIKTSNKELGMDYFEKSLFNSEEFLKNFNSLNLSQALYSKFDSERNIHEFINGIRHFGYKIAIDTAAIREFFSTPINMSVGEATRYSRYAKYINNYANSVKAGTLLRAKQANINSVLIDVMQKIQSRVVPDYLKALVPNENYIYNYAILQFIYNSDDILDSFWKEYITTANKNKDKATLEVIDMLMYPKKYIRQTQYTDATISFLGEADTYVKAYKENIDSELLRYREAIDEFMKLNKEYKDYERYQSSLEKLERQSDHELWTYQNSRRRWENEQKIYKDRINTEKYGEAWTIEKEYTAVEDRISYLRNKLNYLDSKIISNKLNKEELNTYKTMFTELLEEADAEAKLIADIEDAEEGLRLLNNKRKSVESIMEKYENKIAKIREVADIEAIHKTLEDAVAKSQDKVDYFKSVAKGLDDNSAQRAVMQRKAASYNKVHDALVQHQNLVAQETSLTGKLRVIKNMREYTNRMTVLEAHQIFTMSDDELFNHLATNAKRIIAIDIGDFSKNQMLIDDVLNLYSRKDELKTKGIDIISESTEHIGFNNKMKGVVTGPPARQAETWKSEITYIVLNKDVKLDYLNGKIYSNGTEVIAPKLKDFNVEDLVRGLDMSEAEINFYLKELQEARVQMINLTNGATVGALGEVANKTYYKTLYSGLNDSIKELLPSFDEMINKDTVGAFNFNHSVLGSPYKRKEIASQIPSDILSIYANSSAYLAEMNSTMNEYLQLYYDNMFSINVGFPSTMTDIEMFDALRNTREFVLTYLKDVDGTAVPIEIKLTSPKVIEEARRLNAIVVPRQTFNKAFSTLQTFKISDTRLNWWHKLIFAYKTGFLANAGVLFRNVIDSTVKNMISTGDPLGIVQHYAEGMKTYYNYRTIMKEVIDMHPKHKLTGANLEFYFKNMNPDMDFDMFKLVHGYMADGPSAGEIPELLRYYKENKTIKGGIWDTYVNASSYLLSANNEFEHIARISEYLWAIKNGYTNSAAYDLITKTHFDYGLKTKSQLLTELVFPFYTFKMRNLEYWIDAVEDNPWLASLFRDIMTPIWDFDEYDENELEYNRSLQYQILSGNLPLHKIIKSAPEELTLKLNPSFMDTYNTLTDPMGAVQSSLAPPLKFMLNMATKGVDEDGFMAKTLGQGQNVSFLGTGGYDDSIVSLIPFAGALYQRQQNAEKYGDRTGMGIFDIPFVGAEAASILGATQRWEDRAPKVYSQNKPLFYNSRPYTKKPRKTYARKASIYPKRVKQPKKIQTDYAAKPKHYQKNFYHKANYNNDNLYKKLYTNSGASKLKSMMEPTTPTTLKYKLRIMHNYFR